ncbi:hypothetical protein E2562_027203 [Oryza meyeriana var. granulata]|uniref:Uncharacterized protein n=1 Tax=Oryza meyeriana var. granulata TaxID=110450 RepID=A0A6G1EZK7_9ORYZ|nr:hypothetical protein E2562_027203 [Oryza meyeriana var. granulata]
MASSPEEEQLHHREPDHPPPADGGFGEDDDERTCPGRGSSGRRPPRGAPPSASCSPTAPFPLASSLTGAAPPPAQRNEVAASASPASRRKEFARPEKVLRAAAAGTRYYRRRRGPKRGDRWLRHPEKKHSPRRGSRDSEPIAFTNPPLSESPTDLGYDPRDEEANDADHPAPMRILPGQNFTKDQAKEIIRKWLQTYDKRNAEHMEASASTIGRREPKEMLQIYSLRIVFNRTRGDPIKIEQVSKLLKIL